MLVTGWGSVEHGELTAGDLEALETLTAWLAQAGVAYDVAWSPVLAAAWGGPTLDDLCPGDYTDLVFVCGPAAGDEVEGLLARFGHCRTTAVGVTVVDPAPGFDAVVARDDGGPGWPDLAWGRPARPVPLVAVVRANPQPEYAGRGRHEAVHARLDTLLAQRLVARLDVDTRLDPRLAGQRDPGQVDALLGAADVVVTTRLHGLVLGLRAGTPVVAVDPVTGGAKVSHQARALGWPVLVEGTCLDDDTFWRAVDYCGTDDARQHVRRVAYAARRRLDAMAAHFFDAAGLAAGGAKGPDAGAATPPGGG